MGSCLEEFKRVSLGYCNNKELCTLLWRSEGVKSFPKKYLNIVIVGILIVTRNPFPVMNIHTLSKQILKLQYALVA